MVGGGGGMGVAGLSPGGQGQKVGAVPLEGGNDCLRWPSSQWEEAPSCGPALWGGYAVCVVGVAGCCRPSSPG